MSPFKTIGSVGAALLFGLGGASAHAKTKIQDLNLVHELDQSQNVGETHANYYHHHHHHHYYHHGYYHHHHYHHHYYSDQLKEPASSLPVPQVKLQGN